MFASRPIAAVSLAVFLLGGWLPQVWHGPGHLTATGIAGQTPAASDAASSCSCGHDHGVRSTSDDAPSGDERPSDSDDCPVCELISILTLPVATACSPANVWTVRSEPVRGSVVAVATDSPQPPLRGPPTV